MILRGMNSRPTCRWSWLAGCGRARRRLPVAERFIPVIELLEERIQLSTTILPNPVVVGDFSLISGPVAGIAPSTTFDDRPVAFFSDAFIPVNTAPELYIAQINWGDGTSSPGSITASIAPVTVSVYKDFTTNGGGQPYSNLIGTFFTSDVQFV